MNLKILSGQTKHTYIEVLSVEKEKENKTLFISSILIKICSIVISKKKLRRK